MKLNMPANAKKNPFLFSLPMGSVLSGGVAASAWRGLGTTGKVGVGIIGGGLAVGTYDWLFGGKKAATQEQKQQQQQTTNQITKTDSPVTTTTTSITTNNSYQVQTGSPGAYQAWEKKDSVATSPSVGISPAWSVAPSLAASQAAEQGQTAGTDMTTLAIIVAVGILGAGYLSGRKGGKRK